MKERRLQIFSLDFGKRSLKFLLEESKLRDCGLVGEKEYTDDGPNKYSKWQDVPVPLNYKSPLNMPLVLRSAVQALERTQSEHKGILACMLSIYYPTLVETIPNKLISFPRHPDHNFFVWANPDLVVHKYDSGLKSWQIKYSAEEHIDEYLDQYGMDELEDFSHLDLRVEDLVQTTTLAELELASPS